MHKANLYIRLKIVDELVEVGNQNPCCASKDLANFFNCSKNAV